MPVWKRFFAFTFLERRGYLLLMVLIFLAGGWRLYWQQPQPFPVPEKEVLSQWRAFQEAKQKTEDRGYAEEDVGTKGLQKDHLQPFNPNQVDSAQLADFGVRAYVVQNWLKYRRAGGAFRSPDDVAKIYGLSDSVFEQLQPYIRCPPSKKRSKRASRASGSKPPDRSKRFQGQASRNRRPTRIKIDINRADSATWTQLRGIGPVFASRIVRYRALLGGYVDSSQLLEVYGLDSSRLTPLWEHIIFEDSSRRRMAANLADVATLGGHPYLSFQQARRMVAYRRQHGPFQGPEDLLRVHGFEAAVVRKITPYLDFKE